MKRARTLGCWIAGLLLASTTVFAGSLAEIKSRMKERLPALEQLKDRGVVGENNRGYLEFVTPTADADRKKLLDAENADRRAVYAALAAQTGATAESVGARRALQIRQEAKPGTWVQDAQGNWSQVK